MARIMPRNLRLTAPREYEQQLHEATARLLALVLRPPAMFQCIDLGALELAPHQTAKLARMGMMEGWPDFIVLCGGMLRGIELKVPGGRLTKTRAYRTRRGTLMHRLGQEEVFPLLYDAGMVIRVCFSIEDVVRALGDWGIPMRTAPAQAAVLADEIAPDPQDQGRLSDHQSTPPTKENGDQGHG